MAVTLQLNKVFLIANLERTYLDHFSAIRILTEIFIWITIGFF